jgi:hypothetical protein
VISTNATQLPAQIRYTGMGAECMGMVSKMEQGSSTAPVIMIYNPNDPVQFLFYSN